MVRTLLAPCPSPHQLINLFFVQLVELKNGETYNGHMIACDNFMNITLRDVILTAPDGDKFYQMKEVYLKGNVVRSLCLALIDWESWIEERHTGGAEGQSAVSRIGVAEDVGSRLMDVIAVGRCYGVCQVESRGGGAQGWTCWTKPQVQTMQASSPPTSAARDGRWCCTSVPR